jgi:hypothetical protein
MKTYKGSRSTPAPILNLIAPSIEGWLCPRAGVDVTEDMKPLVPASIGTQCHPLHSLDTDSDQATHTLTTPAGKASQ